MKRFFAVTFLVVFTAFIQANDLKVGVAAVNLVADDSMEIAGGILPKLVEGQEGDLRVTAVAVENPGQPTVAIVACDVLFVTRDYVDAALAEIEKATGILKENILVNATHTHHAPSTAKVHGYDLDKVFTKRLGKGIVEAVVKAHANLAGPVRFSYKLGEEKTVGGNSRLLLKDGKIRWTGSAPGKPTGPFDPQLPVLAFHDEEDNKLRALIYNHSTHTIGTIKGRVRSPSFYGLAAQELETQFPGATVCFLEGASGSTHNVGRVPTGVAVERMKRAIVDALEKAAPIAAGEVKSVKREFIFKVRKFDEAVEDEKVTSYVGKYASNNLEPVSKVFRDMRKDLAPHQGEERKTWLQVMRIGDVVIVGIPAEYFTLFGVDIKKRSPFKHTLVAELANDWIGYLPDREGHKLGGYQTWMGYHSYAEPGTGERIADEIVDMLVEMKKK